MSRPDRRAACPSSPFPRLAAPAALAPDQGRSLLDHLAQLTDPRHRRGRQHTLGTVLAVAVAAVLAGARSLAAIGGWTADSLPHQQPDQQSRYLRVTTPPVLIALVP